MNTHWRHVVVTGIRVAVYVAPNTGRHTHKNRPFHGLVLNDANSIKNYRFDNGLVLKTEAGSLFYLPKGSSYHVESLRAGGCYAINFDADIFDDPFSISFRNSESLLRAFKSATDAWKRKDDMRSVIAMRAIYDAVEQAQKELARQYVSGNHAALLRPALEIIEHRFSENELSVAYLAALCGISEVYFRRLFFNTLGIAPKEYIIRKRIDYAKSLLRSRGFSVSEVAALCGYAEPCHFSREFTKRVGTPPSRFWE